MNTERLYFDEYIKFLAKKNEGGIAVVTGATGRIGGIFTNALLYRGFRVIACSRNQIGFESFQAKIPHELLKNIEWHKLDLRNKESITELIENINCKHGSIDFIVNSAIDVNRGMNYQYHEDNLESECWGALAGSILLIEGLLPNLRKSLQANKKIINVSSLWGTVVPDFNTYLDLDIAPSPVLVCGKFAINGYTKYLASREAKFGITCNALAPGFFPKKGKNDRPDYVQEICRRTMVKRIGNLDELIPAIHFLIDDLGYTTGSIVSVDGGYTAW